MPNPNSLRRVVVLHGYTASPDSHWFPWLTQELAPDGINVAVPKLPDSAKPDPTAWRAAAFGAIGRPDADLVIVGHSLGCITALGALEQTSAHEKIAGLIMVAGFDQTLSTLPALSTFTEATPNYELLRKRSAYRSVIVSDNDVIVDPALSRAFAKRLEATVRTIPGGGHFLSSDGFDRLPAVAEDIRAAFQSIRNL